MVDVSTPVAVQTTNAPTNKLAVGTTAAGAVGGVIAGVLAAYGGDAIKEVLANTSLGPAMTNLIVMVIVTVATFFATKYSGTAAGYNVLDRPNVPINSPVAAPDGIVRSPWYIGAVGVLLAVLLVGCGENGTFNIPTPSSILGSGSTTEGKISRLEQFCATDISAQPAAAITEWVVLYNVLAPVINRDPIDTTGLTKSEAVQRLLAARGAICIATQPVPAPEVVEAIEEAA